MKRLILFLFCSIVFLLNSVSADIGVLIPGDREEPDPSILTLEEAHVDIRIDHQYARVRIIQIFGNHTSRNQEGKFVFAVPGNGTISDFAVWDGVVRIPGVILERKRASELYEEIRIQEIDPGLLQQEEGAEGPRMANIFSARIVPILPFSTKRLEIEYTQPLPVDRLKSFFSFPLRPNLYAAQRVTFFTLKLEILSDAPLIDFKTVSSMYPLRLEEQSLNRISASFTGTNLLLQEDFAFQYQLDVAASTLYFLAYRKTGEDGYFWASTILNQPSSKKVEETDPRSFVILFDISSSMRWEKLDQSYRALEYFLTQLPESHEFQLILFHQETFSSTSGPVPTTRSNVRAALEHLKTQYLMGGTDFEKAFSAAFSAAKSLKNRERYLILITDGNPTLTQLQSRELLHLFEQENEKANFRAFCFGIGSDTNQTLLSGMAEKSVGSFEWVTEGEDLSFKLESFFSKIGQYPIPGITLSASESDLLYQVYPSDPAGVYDRTSIDWFGRYRQPVSSLDLRVTAENLNLLKTVALPEEAIQHDFIPRQWARRRVDALLRKIELEGEEAPLIDEIIRLSKKYKFVTPYTSFLAAPRSLLRPRVIRPGDPLLRVRTDPEIVSVIAVFPFGLIKNLEYLSGEDIWQTRFLVPKEVSDGTYYCRLILKDRSGHLYYEKKSYLVDSKPPDFQVRYSGAFQRGKEVKLVVSADQDTRFLYARLESQLPVAVRWSQKEKACIGTIRIPEDLPPGSYRLEILGIDFAHNESRWSQKVEVL